VAPRYGEVWLCELYPVRGHEQAGRRPALVVSPDRFNQGPAGLVIVVPLTTRDRRVPLHVAIDPPEGGLRGRRFALCEMVRSISQQRLAHASPWGEVSRATMVQVADRLRVLLPPPL
jgi:mRNA interferase MazF